MPRSLDPGSSNTAPGATPTLDEEYAKAIDEWREESRWAEFLAGIISAKGPAKLNLSHLSGDDLGVVVVGMNDLAFDCFWPWAVIRDAQFRGKPSDDIKRAFLERWRTAGPKIHAKRVLLVIEITEKVWGPEHADLLKLLEKQYPDERLGTTKIPDMRRP
jgi:hypothetical protein